MKKHETFVMGVAVGYLIEKYKGNIILGLEHLIHEYEERRQAKEIEQRRVVDVFGDEI